MTWSTTQSSFPNFKLILSTLPGFPLTLPATLNRFVQLTGVETVPYPIPIPTQFHRCLPRILHHSVHYYSKYLSTTYPSMHLRRTWYSTLMIPNFWSQAKNNPSQSSLPVWSRLSSLGVWFHSHGLKVNTGKTELIICGSPQNCHGIGPGYYSAPRGHSTWEPRSEEPWRALRQEPLVGLTRICPRQKMQRYPHRPVPRASLDPNVTSTYQSTPWSSRTSDIVRQCLETAQRTTCSASRRYSILACALSLVDVNLTTYWTCERNWAGSPPVSSTNFSLSTFFTKCVEPENRRLLLPGFFQTLKFVLKAPVRTLTWPSRAREPPLASVEFYTQSYSGTIACLQTCVRHLYNLLCNRELRETMSEI